MSELREISGTARRDEAVKQAEDARVFGAKESYNMLLAMASAQEVTNEELASAITSQQRKECPVFSGVLAYFPDALLLVAKLSKIGNDKHNPGQPLHWSKGKSSDHADCLVRHLMTQGSIDPETGLSHTVAVAWRALALLQTEIENGKTKG